jgi:hypothetical protein
MLKRKQRQIEGNMTKALFDYQTILPYGVDDVFARKRIYVAPEPASENAGSAI